MVRQQQHRLLAITAMIAALLLQLGVKPTFVGTAAATQRTTGALNQRTVMPMSHRVTAKAGRDGQEMPDVIALAKSYVEKGSGFYDPVNPDLMAEDFVFRGEFIGPLNKKDYVKTMSTLKVYEPFPDLAANAFGFTVDPADALRVWFFVRNTGTHTAPWPILSGVDALTIPATGAKLEGATEAFSMTFSPEGKLRHLTVGYVANKYEGNAGGVGAAFALFNVIGYGQLAQMASLPSVRDFANFLSDNVDARIAKTRSKDEDLPSWYSE
mmetsp:Transcript_64082/g.119121  ORF Transcript_64082/g.119121 Transcript_64082/m.119121 type:complete len:268 (-) Transcript_64082:63-866(-)